MSKKIKKYITILISLAIILVITALSTTVVYCDNKGLDITVNTDIYGEGLETIDMDKIPVKEGLTGKEKIIDIQENSDSFFSQFSYIKEGGKGEDIINILHLTGKNSHDAVINKISYANCIKNGEIELYCASCDKIEKFILPPLGHTYDNGVVTKEPTCTEKGVKTYTCLKNGCGDTYTEDIEPLGHIESEFIIDKPATMFKEGSKHTECTRCGEIIKTETIPTLSKMPLYIGVGIGVLVIILIVIIAIKKKSKK